MNGRATKGAVAVLTPQSGRENGSFRQLSLGFASCGAFEKLKPNHNPTRAGFRISRHSCGTNAVCRKSQSADDVGTLRRFWIGSMIGIVPSTK